MSMLKKVLFLSFLSCVISYNPVLASNSDGEDAEHLMRAMKKARGTLEGSSQAIPQAAQISAPQERTVERKQPQQNAQQLSQPTTTVKKQIRGRKPVETPRAESAPITSPSTQKSLIPPVNGQTSISAQPLKLVDTTPLRLALEQIQRSSLPRIPSVLSAPNSHQTTAQTRVEPAQNQQVQAPLQLASLNSLTTLNLFQNESPDFQEALRQDALIQAMSLYTGRQQHFIDRWASVLKKLPYTTLREIHLSGALRDQFVEDAPYWNIDTYRLANTLNMSHKNLVLPPFYSNGTLSQMVYLSLASNNLITVHGLNKLTNLTSLDISDNKLLNRIDGIEHLSNLRALRASNNPQYIPKVLKLVNTNLTKLDLSSNSISSLDRSGNNLPNLRFLCLSNNQLTRLDGLQNSPNLELLYLNNNCLSHLDGLGHLTNLKALSVAENPLSRLDGLQNLTNLTSLHLSQDQMDNPAIAAVVNALPQRIERSLKPFIQYYLQVNVLGLRF